MKSLFLRLAATLCIIVILCPPVIVENWASGDSPHPPRLRSVSQRWLPLPLWISDQQYRTRPDFPKLIYSLVAANALALAAAYLVSNRRRLETAVTQAAPRWN